MANFCHEGTEGVTFAILTSYSNVAGTVAGTLSNFASWIWRVDQVDIVNHDYEGMWKLTLFTSLVSILPLLLMPSLLPSATEQKAMELSEESSSVGGGVFLGVLLFSLCWSFTSSILDIEGVW